MPHFAALTEAQRSQVAFLFADEIFGTDPSLFDYELRGETVTGRKRIDAVTVDLSKSRVSVNVCVMDVPEQFVTVDMLKRRDHILNALARKIVERMVEVEPVISNS